MPEPLQTPRRPRGHNTPRLSAKGALPTICVTRGWDENEERFEEGVDGGGGVLSH